MSRTQSQRTRRRPSQVSRALAADRLGVPAVLFFVLAGVAPLTAGVIPTAYQTTGLTGIPAAFIAVALILALLLGRLIGSTLSAAGTGRRGGFGNSSPFSGVNWPTRRDGFGNSSLISRMDAAIHRGGGAS